MWLCLKARKITVQDKRYQPTIYQNWICDVIGSPPFEEDVKLLIQTVRAYAGKTDNDLAQDIDTIVGNCPKIVWAKGERRYLRTARHYQLAERLCKAMSLELRNQTRRPFVETGYTNNAYSRLRQHRQHQSSNRLMNLVDAICKLKLPHFRLHQFVIFDIWEVNQAWAGEILFDRLSGGWMDEGHGFTFFHAGINVRSSLKFNTTEWDQWMEYAVQNTPFTRNMDKQIALRMRQSQEQTEKAISDCAALWTLVGPLMVELAPEHLQKSMGEWKSKLVDLKGEL